MASPVGVHVHADRPLSNLAVEAFNTLDDQFIGDRLLPSIPVMHKSDTYYKLDKEAFFSIESTLRAPKTEARKVSFTVSSDQYLAKNYMLGSELALEDIADADTAIMLRQNSVRLVVSQLRRDQEDRIARLVTSASNLGSGTTLSSNKAWNNYADSDPIADVTTGTAHIRSVTGLLPNTLVMDWDTSQVLRRHPIILDYFKYNRGGMVTMGELREVFQIDNIMVGRSIKENARENVDSITNSMTNIWGNNVLLAHMGPATGMQSRTLAARFNWRPSGFPAAFVVERRTVNGAGTRRVEVVEAGYFQDEKIIAPDLGYLISGTIASLG